MTSDQAHKLKTDGVTSVRALRPETDGVSDCTTTQPEVKELCDQTYSGDSNQPHYRNGLSTRTRNTYRLEWTTSNSSYGARLLFPLASINRFISSLLNNCIATAGASLLGASLLEANLLGASLLGQVCWGTPMSLQFFYCKLKCLISKM